LELKEKGEEKLKKNIIPKLLTMLLFVGCSEGSEKRQGMVLQLFTSSNDKTWALWE